MIEEITKEDKNVRKTEQMESMSGSAERTGRLANRRSVVRCSAIALIISGVVIQSGAMMLSGCAKRKAPAVVGEKVNGQEKEGAGDETPGGNGAAGDGGTQPAGVSLGSLGEMVKAPESYKASVTGDHIVLTADAPVKMPEAEGMSARRVTAENFTEKEYQEFLSQIAGLLDATFEEEKLNWKFPVGTEKPYYQSNTLKDREGKEYAAWYYAENAGNGADLSWADENTYMGVWKDREYRYRNFASKENFPDDFQEELRTGAELKKLQGKAQELLGTLGAGDRKPALARWILSAEDAQSDGGGNPEPMAQFFFTRQVGGAPVLYGEPPIPFEKTYRNAEAVEIILDRSGELMHVYFRNKEKIDEGKREPQFLLPFSEVCRIFEQVMESKGEDFGALYFAGEDVGKETGKEMGRETAIHVTSVALGYRSVYDRDGEKLKAEGMLVPVWNFYGTVGVTGKGEGGVTVSQTFERPGTALLTVNAADGTVIGE